MMLQIHESIGHALEIDRILGDERNYAGWSFVKLEDFGRLQYGSEHMNITFDPTLESEFASYAFDDGGLKATKEYLKDDLPQFRAGDRVSVDYRVIEGGKERIQKFQGDVIGKKGGSVEASFTVRKISGGVGVERIFPLHSPMVAKIKVIRRGKVRRAKLNYLKNLKGKAARISEKR